MRHTKPVLLIQYEERMKERPPQLCHNCAFYLNNGQCEIHKSEPPEDFAATAGACDEWELECPF